MNMFLGILVAGFVYEWCALCICLHAPPEQW
jgi:hypothetical protein